MKRIPLGWGWGAAFVDHGDKADHFNCSKAVSTQPAVGICPALAGVGRRPSRKAEDLADLFLGNTLSTILGHSSVARGGFQRPGSPSPDPKD